MCRRLLTESSIAGQDCDHRLPNSCGNFDWARDLHSDWVVDVDAAVHCTDGYNQAVSNRTFVALMSGILFPPTADRIDPNRRALRKVDCGAPPIIGVDGANVPDPAAQEPVVRPGVAGFDALFFGCRRGVNSLAERIDRFERPLDRKPKPVGRISVPAEPAALARVRLHIIRG